MIAVRRAAERFQTDAGWLNSKHTFSFGEHYSPQWMGFRALRVINEDRVEAGQGFPTHGHRDMEIVSYVLDGALEHRDSLGTGSVIRAGDIQRMSAGTGVRHSEYNASSTDQVHFLQIWIIPSRPGLPPGYEQKVIPAVRTPGELTRIAGPQGGDGAVTLHQDASIHAGKLADGETVEFPLSEGRHAWVQVARGQLALNGEQLQAGDGAAVTGIPRLSLQAKGPAEVLVFDLA